MKREAFVSLLTANAAVALTPKTCGEKRSSVAAQLSPTVPAGLTRVMTSRQGALSAALRRPATLAYYAARAGILFGTSIDGPGVRDSDYFQVASHECSLMNAWGMSPNITRRRRSGFDFSNADRLVRLANDDNLAVCGGYLSDHGSEPSWITTTTDRKTALGELQLIITTTMRHYAGRLDYWIVCNEAIYPGHRNPYSFRSCTWRTTIGGDISAGTDYVTEAFQAARLADPTATLVYANNLIEDGGSEDTARRDGVLALLGALKRRGLVDALGIQGHLTAISSTFDPGALKRFLDCIYDLGLKIVVTEMDVNDVAAPAAIETRDAIVAEKITAFLRVVLAHPGVESITVWGLSDNHSWYNTDDIAEFRRSDGLPQRGTLLDSSLGRKPVYYATREAFTGAHSSRAPRVAFYW
jgi:endo-1,4-beta-xylanase